MMKNSQLRKREQGHYGKVHMYAKVTHGLLINELYPRA